VGRCHDDAGPVAHGGLGQLDAVGQLLRPETREQVEVQIHAILHVARIARAGARRVTQV